MREGAPDVWKDLALIVDLAVRVRSRATDARRQAAERRNRTRMRRTGAAGGDGSVRVEP